MRKKERERRRVRRRESEREDEEERERESAPVSKLSSWIAQVHLQARVRIQYDLNNAHSKVNWSSGSKEKYGHACSQIS